MKLTYRTIVFGTDGSGLARQAQRVANSLAKSSRATLHIIHAHERKPKAGALERAVADAKAFGLEPEAQAVKGDAADVLLEQADRADADLIVVGSRGLSRAQRVLIGSVSHRVAQHAPCDVLIVRRAPSDRTAKGRPYERVVVGTDGSVTADRAARKGYALAARIKAPVTLVFVGHPATGEIVLRDTHASAEDEVEASFELLEGDPADRICETATPPASLIVIGNKGMTGAARFLLGSVPLKVLQYAPSDIYIARTVTQTVAEVAPGEGGIVTQDGRKVAVYRDENGALHTLSARCTHLGCTVDWNPGEKTWDCPCHGSRFSCFGDVVAGPATEPLKRTAL